MTPEEKAAVFVFINRLTLAEIDLILMSTKEQAQLALSGLIKIRDFIEYQAGKENGTNTI